MSDILERLRSNGDDEAADEIERLRVMLQVFITVAESDGWDEALTGRQIIIRKARAALDERDK